MSDGERQVHMEQGRVVITRTAPTSYRLCMVHRQNGAETEASGPDRAHLLDLCEQLEALDYTFTRLELVTEVK